MKFDQMGPRENSDRRHCQFAIDDYYGLDKLPNRRFAGKILIRGFQFLAPSPEFGRGGPWRTMEGRARSTTDEPTMTQGLGRSWQ